jgi:hypothetical protein
MVILGVLVGVVVFIGRRLLRRRGARRVERVVTVEPLSDGLYDRRNPATGRHDLGGF